MKKLILIAVLIIQTAAFAQNLSKTGVLKLTVKSSGAIIQDEQVRGYYQFYLVDKQDRNNYNYQLTILDENLREVSSVNFTRPKNFTLIEGTFNEETFAFLFYDTEARAIEVVGYDKTLKVSGRYRKTLDNKYALSIFNTMAVGGASSSVLVPVSKRGFLLYGVKPGKKLHYQIQFLDNEMKLKWTDYSPENTKNAYEMASDGFQTRDYVGALIMKKASVSNRNVDVDLLVLDAASGKNLFRTPMQTDKYNLSFSDVYYDSVQQNFTVFGEYFDIRDKELKAKSLGFMALVVNLEGKITLVKTNSWETDISKVAPVNEKGKFDGNNASILFHNVVRTDDGRVFVIGEQYKKAASAGGIVGNVFSIALLGQQVTSNVQLNVYGMVVFEFNPDYSLRKLHMFEKEKNVLQLPAGYGSLTNRTLSYYAKAVGGFDYAFTQSTTDRSSFFISFINYNREGGGRSKNTLGTIVYTPEKTFTVDKIVMNRTSTDYFVYRAKEGYVMVTEYFKKEKRLETRLEKVNY